MISFSAQHLTTLSSPEPQRNMRAGDGNKRPADLSLVRCAVLLVIAASALFSASLDKEVDGLTGGEARRNKVKEAIQQRDNDLLQARRRLRGLDTAQSNATYTYTPDAGKNSADVIRERSATYTVFTSPNSQIPMSISGDLISLEDWNRIQEDALSMYENSP